MVSSLHHVSVWEAAWGQTAGSSAVLSCANMYCNTALEPCVCWNSGYTLIQLTCCLLISCPQWLNCWLLSVTAPVHYTIFLLSVRVSCNKNPSSIFLPGLPLSDFLPFHCSKSPIFSPVIFKWSVPMSFLLVIYLMIFRLWDVIAWSGRPSS